MGIFGRSKARDRKIAAKKPGRRISKAGNRYYERRGNRADRGRWL